MARCACTLRVLRTNCTASHRLRKPLRRTSPAPPQIRFRPHHARGLFPQRWTRRRSDQRSTPSSPKGQWPGSRHSARSTRPTSGNTIFEVDRPYVESRPLFARVCVDLRRVGNDAGVSRDEPHLPRVAAISTAGRAGSRRHQETRSRRTCSRRSGRSTSIHAPSSHRARAQIRRASPTLLESGPPSRKVDLLLISDGYSAVAGGHISRRRRPARRRAVRARAVQIAPRGFQREGARTCPARTLAVEFNIFGLERYALTYDNRALRNVAAAAPYDVVAILMNDTKYGGGGIFNQQSTVAAANESAGYVFIHELAHNLAGLGDEYVGDRDLRDRRAAKGRAVGAEHHGAARSFGVEVARSRGAGHASSDADVICRQGRRVRRRRIRSARSVSSRGRRASWDRARSIAFCRVCQRAINRIIDLHTN